MFVSFCRIKMKSFTECQNCCSNEKLKFIQSYNDWTRILSKWSLLTVKYSIHQTILSEKSSESFLRLITKNLELFIWKTSEKSLVFRKKLFTSDSFIFSREMSPNDSWNMLAQHQFEKLYYHTVGVHLWVRKAVKSILLETLFLIELHTFSLLSSNSFIQPFWKPEFLKKILATEIFSIVWDTVGIRDHGMAWNREFY